MISQIDTPPPISSAATTYTSEQTKITGLSSNAITFNGDKLTFSEEFVRDQCSQDTLPEVFETDAIDNGECVDRNSDGVEGKEEQNIKLNLIDNWTAEGRLATSIWSNS